MKPRFPLAPLWAVPLLLAGAFLEAPARAFQVLVFAALLAALWGAGRRIAGWLVPDFAPLSAAIATFTAAVGLATTLALALGTCGWLRPPAFLLGTAILYLTCLAIPLGRPPEEPGAAAGKPWPLAVRVEAVVLSAALAALVIVTLATLRQERLAPPEAFDDLSYHLPAVATWHRYGDLRMMKLAYGDPSTPFYPIVAELWTWVLVAPFNDSDVAARWSQLPFALFSALAAAAVARRLGLSRRGAALAVLLYLSIRHVMPGLALSAGNDHTAGFFTLAALDGVLATARHPGRRNAAYTGLALGLLAGTKYLALFYCATLFVLLGVGLALRRCALRRLLEILGLAFGIALLAGGYTYLRNAWTTGNPVFPAPVHLFGLEVFPGWPFTGLADRLQLPEARIDIPEFLLHRPDLFGALAPFTLVPAALLAPLVALVLAWRRWNWGRTVDLTPLVLALPALLFLEFVAFMHDHRDPRYVLAGMALAGVAFAWLTERAGPWVGAALRIVVALWVIHDLLRRFRTEASEEALQAALLLGGAALALFLGPRLAARAARPAWRRGAAGVALAALGVAAVPLGQVVETYQKRKLRGEPAARALEEWLAPGGARLAYVGWNQPYLYFGSRLQNRVEIVPHTRNAADRFYDWGQEPAPFPFDRRRPNRWLHRLDELGIGYVVVILRDDPGPERRWIESQPRRFTKVFEHVAVEVWRVGPPPSI